MDPKGARRGGLPCRRAHPTQLLSPATTSPSHGELARPQRGERRDQRVAEEAPDLGGVEAGPVLRGAAAAGVMRQLRRRRRSRRRWGWGP
jgi:hypothetical protein